MISHWFTLVPQLTVYWPFVTFDILIEKLNGHRSPLVDGRFIDHRLSIGRHWSPLVPLLTTDPIFVTFGTVTLITADIY